MSIVHAATGIDLDNTEWGYAYRSTDELRWAYWIFRLLRWGGLVKMLNSVGSWMVRRGFPVEPALRMTLGRLFLGGESLKEALEVAQKLHKYGVAVLLDYAVEASEKAEEQEATFLAYQEMIRFAGEYRDWIPSVAVKLTALAAPLIWQQKSAGSLSTALKPLYDKGVERTRALAKLAAEKGVILMIDAEESWLQKAIDELVEGLMAEFNKERSILYTTVQMYRRDRLEYVRGLLGRAQGYKPGIKLVRGAYVEKERRYAAEYGWPDPIHPDKVSTDIAYDQALMLCLEALDNVGLCVATHNRTSCMKAAQYVIMEGIDRQHPHLSFSQLYGMADPLSFGLAKAGFRVYKYLPFGPLRRAFPYLSRRAEENSSLSDQSGRELRWISEELERRRKRKSRQ
jgi:proline dehydrogenase